MFKKQDLKDKIYIGVVENVYDETRKGRIQVRVQSVFNDIPLEHIPWAEPQRSLDGRSFSVPSIGKIVNVIFVNGNIYEPQYIYSENYNINLQEKLKDMSDEDYENFTAFLYDHTTQFFVDDNGLTIDHLYNKITMNSDSINLELKNNGGIITLGSKSANQEAVLGTNFFKWMDGFMQTLLTPSSLIGNLNAPILKPQLDAEIMKYQALRQTFVSDNVFLNDDMKIDTLSRESNINMQDVDYTLNNKSLNDEINPKKEVKKKKERKRKEEIDNRPVEEKIADKNKKEMDKMIAADSVELGDPTSGTFIDESNKNMSDESAKEFKYNDDETLKETSVTDNPKSKPVTTDPYASLWDGYKGRSKESYQTEKHESRTYGNYTTDDSPFDNNVDMTTDVNAVIGEYESSGIEWKSCGAFFGASSPYKKETLTSKVDPRLNNLIEFINKELKKWNSTYKIKGVGGARSVEASLITGRKGESTVKTQLPELWEIIKKMRKKYKVRTCSARAMISNHVVGSAIDTKQWINGDVYYYGNRSKNPYTKLMAIPGYKDAMIKALKKWEKINGVHPRWGGTWSCWKSESHHFDINLPMSDRINAIKEGWEEGKKWRVERNPDA